MPRCPHCMSFFWEFLGKEEFTEYEDEDDCMAVYIGYHYRCLDCGDNFSSDIPGDLLNNQNNQSNENTEYSLASIKEFLGEEGI